jgi:hypothetical protein
VWNWNESIRCVREEPKCLDYKDEVEDEIRRWSHKHDKIVERVREKLAQLSDHEKRYITQHWKTGGADLLELGIELPWWSK